LIKTAASVACVSALLVAGTAAAKPTSFDGNWNVQLVTSSGSCDRTYSYSVAVHDGAIQGGASGGRLNGRVGPDGALALSVQHSIATASASGRLRANSGAGSWKVDTLGCSGRWTATRGA
jgi:hypothetical protein